MNMIFLERGGGGDTIGINLVFVVLDSDSGVDETTQVRTATLPCRRPLSRYQYITTQYNNMVREV